MAEIGETVIYLLGIAEGRIVWWEYGRAARYVTHDR